MSTRSGIGFPTDTGMQLKYVHSDGYPSGVGRAIFTNHEWMTVDEMRTFLFEAHPGSFSALAGADWRRECGFTEYPNGPRWSGPNRWTDEAINDFYNKPACYCHGDRSENRDGAEQLIMTFNADPENPGRFNLTDGMRSLGLEYAYLIHHNGVEMHEVIKESGWNDEDSYLILGPSHFVSWDCNLGDDEWEALNTMIVEPSQTT